MLTIEQKKNAVLTELAKITDTEERYRHIISKGRLLGELSEEQKEEKFLIEGCISRAWLIPEFREGKIYFKADSEAAIVKGIIALLLEVYSGNTPSENLSLSPDFLKEGGITEHLSMNRRNGLSSVVKQIMLYSTALKALATR